MIAHRSATSRNVVALLALLVASLGVASLAPAGAPAAKSPTGKLTAAEYKAFLHNEQLTKRFQKTKSAKKGLSLAKASCKAMRKVDTPLLVAAQGACDASVGWLSSSFRFAEADSRCDASKNADPPTCFADLLEELAVSTDALVATIGPLNQEVRRRSFPKSCTRRLSTSQRDLNGLKQLVRDARAMEEALRAGDEKAIDQTAKRLVKSADGLSHDMPGSIKICPHAGR